MSLNVTPTPFKPRINFMLGLTIVGFVLVLAGYWRLQVNSSEKYQKLGEQYRIKVRPIKASRGLIYDRKGRLIAQNRPTYNLVLRRDEMTDSWSRLKPRISSFVGIPTKTLQDRFAQRTGLMSQPVLLKENIGLEEALRIRRNQLRYPGLAIEVTEKRHYIYGDLFSHVLGYVGEVSPRELERNPDLESCEIIGKSGVELAYNSQLTGYDGKRRVHINNKGVYLREEIERPPEPGQNLYLTLDMDLQRLAYDALGQNGGTVVMMDLEKGELMVYLSSPNFDLNLFTSRFTTRQWDSLINSPKKPFLNRPVQGIYAPGSIFKLVTALTALQNNKSTPETTYFCTGSFAINDRKAMCHNAAGHGRLNLNGAVQYSCNVYFWHLAQTLDIDEIAVVGQELGLGKKTGIDLIGERAGLMPDRAWKRKAYKQIWYPGETLNVAIGQGALLTTPLQLTNLIGVIANDGRILTPHFMAKVGKNEVFQDYQTQEQRTDIIDARFYESVKQGMWDVVNHPRGTGKNALVAGYDVCGKTGTAQLVNFKSEEDHKNEKLLNALFAGFAPRKNPKVAILVIVERAGAGGAQAAPIAAKLIEAYRAAYDPVDPT